MDFFAHQDRAQKRTRLLVFLFILATAAIVTSVTFVVGVIGFSSSAPRDGSPVPLAAWLRMNAPALLMAAGGTLAFITLGSLGKIVSLRAGGGTVARSLGGVPVSPEDRDPLKRRLMNVVEEMAIASGVPVPEVYVLENEPAINAFAAGFRPTDAAVAVTRGALERLNRDELQGVVAHEFAHVLNGDMRLNMKLLGVLHGILLIGLLAQMLFRGALWSGRLGGSRKKEGGGAGMAILLMAVALMIIGYVGVFFGRLIQAAVSRQRERLADASGVQFTRNPLGLAGALKKIGGFREGSQLRALQAEEVRHMLFGASGAGWLSLFATHPPLVERIRALDPSFDPERAEHEMAAYADRTPGIEAAGHEAAAGFAGAAPRDVPLDRAAVLRDAGNPGTRHVAYANRLLASAPAELRDAAAQPARAEQLAYAVLLAEDSVTRGDQLDTVARALGTRAGQQVDDLSRRVRALGPEYRMPLLSLAFPALRRLSTEDRARVFQLTESLASADGRYDLFEYVLARLLRTYLLDADRPGEAGQTGARLGSLRGEAATLLAVLAVAGAEGEDWRSAYRAGAAAMGLGDVTPPEPSAIRFSELDRAIDRLEALAPGEARRLVEGLTATIAADGRVTVAEAELLRCVCAALRTPLPPIHAGEPIPADLG